MTTWRGRIKGTINDEFEVEADTEEEAREAALMGWRYVEYEDLEIDSIDADEEEDD
jgi:hypothetical protein